MKGDFNEVLDEMEKRGDHRKSKLAMKDFKKVMDDLALVDVKLDKGWFTWSNNRKGHGLVKERLDRFFVSMSWLGYILFLASNVVRQASFDHDSMILDTLGRVPRPSTKDSRLLFKYETCWSNDGEVRKVIVDAWVHGRGDVLHGVENVRFSLGKWQFGRYNDRKGRIDALTRGVNSIVDGHENKQRFRIRWLRKGDRNTRFFHVRAIYRARKNHIEGLTDTNGRWVTDEKDVSEVARRYFLDLFSSDCGDDVYQVLGQILCCVIEEINEALMG